MAIRNMVRQEDMVVYCESVLHARPAATLVKVAQRFNSEVSIGCNHRMANAKSMLGILSLGVVNGTIVTVTAEGADANDAMRAIKGLFARRFDEMETEKVPVRADADTCRGDDSSRCSLHGETTLPAASL